MRASAELGDDLVATAHGDVEDAATSERRAQRSSGDELVVEVRFDKLEKHRFRHGTKLVRFRDDKDPKQCTWREVRPPRRPDDVAVEQLLA